MGASMRDAPDVHDTAGVLGVGEKTGSRKTEKSLTTLSAPFFTFKKTES